MLDSAERAAQVCPQDDLDWYRRARTYSPPNAS